MINKKLVIAHRGACFYERENTIAAFKKAIALKAEMVEFDIRKTKDNKIIVYHNGKIGWRKDCRLKYAEIDKKLKCKVPILEEVLRFLKGKIKIDVHLKERGYEEDAIRTILKYFKEKDVLISSQYIDSLRKIKEEFPKIKTGLVMDINIKNIFVFPKGKSFDYLIPRWQLINPIFIRRSEKYNKQLIPWTINNKKWAKRLLKNKIVAGILTDRLDLIDQ